MRRGQGTGSWKRLGPTSMRGHCEGESRVAWGVRACLSCGGSGVGGLPRAAPPRRRQHPLLQGHCRSEYGPRLRQNLLDFARLARPGPLRFARSGRSPGGPRAVPGRATGRAIVPRPRVGAARLSGAGAGVRLSPRALSDWGWVSRPPAPPAPVRARVLSRWPAPP